MLYSIDQSLSTQEFRERIYAGEILLFPQHPAIIEFCGSAWVQCEQILETEQPSRSPGHKLFAHWQKKIHEFQHLARTNSRCRDAFARFVESLGLRLINTYCDRFIFRVVPPLNNNPSGSHAFVDTHRDSWGAGIYQQINWWGPLYDYPANTGIEFYPDYFDRPIANTTAEWSYEQYRVSRATRQEELKPEYNSVPSLLEKPQGQCFRPQLKPGDLIAFSSAHLHGSATNRSDMCRFSFETRTVNLDDIRSGLKAPNVDNASDARLLNLFNNMADGRRLSKQDFLQFQTNFG